MLEFILLLSMIFCHIVDDYYLQGCLASMKQRSWWEEKYSNPLYKNDYKCALITHAFSWSFMITLPLYIFNRLNVFVLVLFFINWIVHAYIDDLKANQRKINLIQDQSVHIIQILVLWLCSFI